MAVYAIHQRTPHEQQRRFMESKAPRKVIRAGRRGGKTTGLAGHAVDQFISGRRILYAAPTLDQVDRFWYEVKLSLRDPIEAGVLVKNETRHLIEVPGTEFRIRAKTAWNADSMRGDYADLLILDEAQLMDPEAWTLVGAPMLLDNDGDAVFIYTPPSVRTMGQRGRGKDARFMANLFKMAASDKTGRWQAFHFTSHDNPYLSQDALAEIAKDMTPLAYRMEILGEDIESIPGALWTPEGVDKTRVAAEDFNPVLMRRIAVAVDPPATVGQAGIIVAGEMGGHLYVFRDSSSEYGDLPAIWGANAVTAYHTNNADIMIGEANNGGHMVEQVIRSVAGGGSVNYKMVHASRGKQARAEPVSALWNPPPQMNMESRGHIVGHLPELEEEMISWVPGQGESPNRVDALVWAATELVLAQRPSSDTLEGLGLNEDGIGNRWR